MTEFKKLWVFGDSYTSVDFCVSSADSFWGLTAKQIKASTVVNMSRPGNSLDSVIQLLVGHHNEMNWSTDFILLALPPLERVTVFDNYKDTPYVGQQIDTLSWSATEVKSNSHHGLISLQNYGNDRDLIIHSDRSTVETLALNKIFLLTKWLDSIDANYLIVNVAKPFDKNNLWGPTNTVLPYVLNHNKCLVFENTYFSVNYEKIKPVDYEHHGWFGHHGAAGNKNFFETSILPLLQ